MRKLSETARQLELLVRFLLFLAALAVASRPRPGRHRRSTTTPLTATDRAFLAWLESAFAAAGAGSAVAA